MKTCLVSLVSDQTIPNIIVTMHFRPDYLLLISTDLMEKRGKSQAILDTLAKRGLDYSHACNTIQVGENSIVDLQNKVTQWLSQRPEEYHFIVNLTGGTKLMSIAAYDLFTDFGSEMVYVPIPKNEYLMPFPKRRPKEPVPLIERLSVAEYLTAYCLKITNEAQLDGYATQIDARKETTLFLYNRYLDVRPLLKWFGDLLRPIKKNALKKGYRFSNRFQAKNESQKQLLSMLGFDHMGEEVSKTIHESEWNYLRGGWLEERLFLAVRSVLPPSADIQIGIQVQDLHGNRNEFDVIFTCENVLYLIECKSLGAPESGEQEGAATINAFLYKLGALRQRFGLTPKAFLATTSEDVLDNHGSVKAHLVERGRQFGIQIIPLLKVPDLEAYFADLKSR